MNADGMRVLLEGALGLWGVEAEVEGVSDTAARVIVAGGGSVEVARVDTPLGLGWRVAGAGDRERVHRSLSAMLRDLGRRFAPDRAVGRVMFAEPGAGGEP